MGRTHLKNSLHSSSDEDCRAAIVISLVEKKVGHRNVATALNGDIRISIITCKPCWFILVQLLLRKMLITIGFVDDEQQAFKKW